MNDKASTDVAPAADVAKGTSGDSFGDDELGQLQRILFGDHARQTNDRIDTLEKALLGALSDLSAQMSKDIAAVGKRVDAEAENRSQAATNLSARLEKDIDAAAKSTARLKTELDSAFERMTEALDAASVDTRKQIDEVRSDMTAAIETAQAELEERKLDRGALAALLSATASEL